MADTGHEEYWEVWTLDEPRSLLCRTYSYPLACKVFERAGAAAMWHILCEKNLLETSDG